MSNDNHDSYANSTHSCQTSARNETTEDVANQQFEERGLPVGHAQPPVEIATSTTTESTPVSAEEQRTTATSSRATDRLMRSRQRRQGRQVSPQRLQSSPASVESTTSTTAADASAVQQTEMTRSTSQPLPEKQSLMQRMGMGIGWRRERSNTTNNNDNNDNNNRNDYNIGANEDEGLSSEPVTTTNLSSTTNTSPAEQTTPPTTAAATTSTTPRARSPRAFRAGNSSMDEKRRMRQERVGATMEPRTAISRRQHQSQSPNASATSFSDSTNQCGRPSRSSSPLSDSSQSSSGDVLGDMMESNGLATTAATTTTTTTTTTTANNASNHGDENPYDVTPGAFYVRRRAFGELPNWARRFSNSLRRTPHEMSPLSETSRITSPMMNTGYRTSLAMNNNTTSLVPSPPQSPQVRHSRHRPSNASMAGGLRSSTTCAPRMSRLMVHRPSTAGNNRRSLRFSTSIANNSNNMNINTHGNNTFAPRYRRSSLFAHLAIRASCQLIATPIHAETVVYATTVENEVQNEVRNHQVDDEDDYDVDDEFEIEELGQPWEFVVLGILILTIGILIGRYAVPKQKTSLSLLEQVQQLQPLYDMPRNTIQAESSKPTIAKGIGMDYDWSELYQLHSHSMCPLRDIGATSNELEYH